MMKLLKTGSFIVNILLFLALILLPFGQLARIQIGVFPVYLYLFEPFIAISCLFIILHNGKKHFLHEFPWARPVGIFLSWMLISLFLSSFHYLQSENIVALLYYLRFSMYLIFIILLHRYLHMHRELKSLFFAAIGITTVLTIMFCLVQYSLYQNLGNLAYLGWDPHLGRLVGLFFDPPLAISILSLLALFFFLQCKTIALKWGIPLLLLALAFLTFSRGGYIATMVCLAALLLKKMHLKYLFIGAVLVGGIIFLLPSQLNESLNLKRTTSIFTRLNDYEKAITIWKKEPIIGIGYNHIRYEKDKYSEELITEVYNPSHAAASFHSSFLMILVTGGVIGLILYVWMLLSIARIHQFAGYSILFLSVISLTDNVLLHPFILLLWGVLTASVITSRTSP